MHALAEKAEGKRSNGEERPGDTAASKAEESEGRDSSFERSEMYKDRVMQLAADMEAR